MSAITWGHEAQKWGLVAPSAHRSLASLSASQRLAER